MIKKLLLLLLFFGLSFGQDDYDGYLVGVWNGSSHEETYIFDKDGTGFFLSSSEDDRKSNILIDWEVREIIVHNTLGEKGILTISRRNSPSDFIIVEYMIIPKDVIPESEKDNFREFLDYDGGSLLTTWKMGMKPNDDNNNLKYFEKY